MAKKAGLPTGKVRLPIDDKLRELKTLRVAIVSEIVALEQSGANAVDRAQRKDLDRRARELLAGGEYSVPTSSRDLDAKLFELREELPVVDRAIELGEVQSRSEHVARSRKLVAEHSEEWLDLHRKRVMAVFALVHLNREIEALRKSLVTGGVVPSLPLDNYTLKMFGTDPNTNATGYWPLEYIKAAMKQGVITRKEFDENV